MKSYWIRHGRFANEYSLVYCDSSILEEQAAADGYERITRREAEQYASSERRRRKENPSFSGYATQYIYPYGVDADFENYPWTKCGYLVVRAI